MKLALTALFSLVLVVGFSTNIVQYSKSNKGLFGYNRVNSTYDGVDGAGNDHWTVHCHDPGLIKCNRSSGIQDNELVLFADAQLELINNQIDDEIARGNLTGSLFHKILRVKDGKYTWVAFNTTWQTTNGETTVRIVFDEVPYSL